MPLEIVDVKADVDSVVELVRERADEMDRARRLSDDVVKALARTGINRLMLPTVLGGLQAPVLDMCDVVEGLAAADGSTGWCALIGFGSNIFAGYMPEAGARDVFADPDQGSATMFAPEGRVVPIGGDGPAGGSGPSTSRGDGDGPGPGDGSGDGPADGSHRLTGRWPFTSNCLHSAWAGVGALVEGPDGLDPVPRVVFAPMGAFTIEDTWDSAGLRATGSHHVSAGGVVVDLERSCRFSDRPWPEGTLWRLPLYTVFLPLLATVPLGIARGAVDEIFRLAIEGRTARRGQLVDDPLSMAELAAADTRLRNARAGLRETLEAAHLRAERGDPVDRQLQARILLASLAACDAGVEVTSVVHQLGGGAAAYAGNRLLRSLCDVEAARQHLLFAAKHRIELGKILAGVDVPYPPFVM